MKVLFLLLTTVFLLTGCDVSRSAASISSDLQAESDLEASISSAGRHPTIQDYLRNGSALRDSIDKSAWFYQNEIIQKKQTLADMGIIVAGVGAVSTVTIALSKDDKARALVGTIAGIVTASVGFLQALSPSSQDAVAYFNDCNEAIVEWDTSEKTANVEIARYHYIMLRKKASRIKSIYPELAEFGIPPFQF